MDIQMSSESVAAEPSPEVEKTRLMYECLGSLGLDVHKDNLFSISIDRSHLEDLSHLDSLRTFVPQLKKYYSSDMLTCLHSNNASKQKNPVINAIRQLLKCNYYKLKPVVVCDGYDKATGRKKTRRTYVIRNLE
jgi:hypothetical protein